MFPFSFISGGGVANTARTEAFLTATGITDATIISALNAMDTSLISAGLLPAGTGAGKIKSLYPVVGGSATNHKYNFVNPTDSNAAFRLSFFGGWTHDSSGMLPNGTNAYADTYFIQSTHAAQDSASFGMYYNNSTTSAGELEGAYSGSNQLFGHYAWYLGNLYIGYVSSELDSLAVPYPTDSIGFRGSSRINNTEIILCIDNTTDTVARPSLGVATVSFYLASCNGIGTFSNKRIAFAYLGDGLTAGEMSTVGNISATFQTTLGRAV
jgi:hypothetical protein